MKIKKILPVYASSYYQILLRELNKDFQKNRTSKKAKLQVGTCYQKCIKLAKKDVKYQVKVEQLKENELYQVSMNFGSYQQLVTHRIEQIDDEGVIRITYEEKVIGCSIMSRCLMMVKGRFMRMKVMQFIHYLYHEAECFENQQGLNR